VPSDLRIGDTGPDVERWQRVVGCTTDGIFGPNTARATRIWQGSHGLDQTGAVTAEEWAALAEDEPTIPAESNVERDIQTVLAKCYRRTNRTRVDWVCIHTAECAETNGSAEALARYCASGCDGRNASWHYCADADSIIRCVPEEHVAYCTSTASWPDGFDMRAIHIELAGRASQDDWQWGDDFSRAMLDGVARLVARICRRWSIPVRRVTYHGLMRDLRGITGHVDVSRGPGRGRTNHTDPGDGFPWDDFVAAVGRHYEEENNG
jgi:N-acetyl-anhydromuramyl-L-alanine amidase AmpD